MKKIRYYLMPKLLLLIVIFSGACAKSKEEQPFPYATIEINGKTWLAENLREEIPCMIEFPNAADSASYGCLYTYECAQLAAAALGDGWRIPTAQEWHDLAAYYGGIFYYPEMQQFGNSGTAYKNLLDGGNSGFNARLGGYLTNGKFQFVGELGCYLTSTNAEGNDLFYILFHRGFTALLRNRADKNVAMSVRLIKD